MKRTKTTLVAPAASSHIVVEVFEKGIAEHIGRLCLYGRRNAYVALSLGEMEGLRDMLAIAVDAAKKNRIDHINTDA